MTGSEVMEEYLNGMTAIQRSHFISEMSDVQEMFENGNITEEKYRWCLEGVRRGYMSQVDEEDD